MSPSVWAKHAQTTEKKQQQLLLTLGYTAHNRQLHHAGLSLHPFARSGGLPVHTSARGGVGWGGECHAHARAMRRRRKGITKVRGLKLSCGTRGLNAVAPVSL